MAMADINEGVIFELGGEPYSGVLRHDDEQRALVFVDDQEPVPETLSVSLAAYGLEAPEGHVYIKDWSEHSGLADSLQEHGSVRKVSSVEVGPFDSTAWLVRVTAGENAEEKEDAR